MAMFTGFKPQGMQKIANRLGYSGDMVNFDSYLQQNPEKQRQMIVYEDAARKMAEGGSVVRMANGGSAAERAKLQRIMYDSGANEYEKSQARNKLNALNNPQNQIKEIRKPVMEQFPLAGMLGTQVGTLGGTPSYVSPIMPPTDPNNPFGPVGAAVMRYGYNPTTNQYSISGGGGQEFPEGFESSMDYGELYKKYPQIKGVFEGGRPQPKTLQDMMVGEPGPPIMTSPGFDPRYEGRNAQDYGQQNRIPTFDYLYGQTPPPASFGGDPEPFYRPKPGETLYRTDQAAMAENPNYPGFIARAAVEPREGGQYAHTRTGERVTVPLGFFGTPPGGSRFDAAIDQRTAPQLVDPRDNVATPAPIPPQGSLPTQPAPIQNISTTSDITDVTAQRLAAPALPQGTQIQGVGIGQEAGQFIPTNQGQVSGAVAVPTAMATTTMAEIPATMDANVMTAETASANVGNTLNTVQAAQATQDPKAQVVAAQQVKSAVGDLNAAQGNATVLTNPVQREIQAGELVSSTANAEKAKAFAEQIQAATASPTDKATVQGQLATLTANFDATNPPAWAAGAIRGVQAVMQQRGLGASSIAGQALVQAAMESAIPIAQADARTVATFEAQNLSNRQQRAMLSAQQRAAFIGQEFDQEFQARVQNSARISDVANRNFTAEQQIALENSKVANTVNLQNLSNSQALIMAEASALASLDSANLNARQQAAVQNAQNFLQQDMANLSNQQQVELFKAQQRVQSLFTDQAATNASNQFNASSQNQVDQFFANLATQSAQFNATQANAQSQYNAGQRNVLERFNAELNNQRDTFNAQNRLVIDQNNAQWRRQIATADTASTNRINELNANNLLNISNLSYNNLWQYYADTMEWAWTSAENELNRYADMSIANLNADTQSEVAKRGESTAAGSAIGSLIGTLGSAYIGSMFGGCWVAREVYGNGNPNWFVFRMWLKYKAPKWFNKLYKKHGEAYASYISNKPKLKWLTKKFMDFIIKEKGKALKCQPI